MFGGAAIAGMVVGKTAKRLLIGFGITLLFILPLVLLAVCRISILKETLIAQMGQSGHSGVVNAEMTPYMLTAMDIPNALIWKVIAIFSALVMLVYLLTFNCRKSANNIYIATGGAILAGGAFYFCSVWGFHGIAAFIMIFGEYPAFPMNKSLVFTMALSAAMLAAWTILCFKSERRGWKILLAWIAAIVGVYAFIWLAALATAYSYARYAKSEAEKNSILPLRVEQEFPSEARDALEIISRFPKDHTDFALPYNSIYAWSTNEAVSPDRILPSEKREYTLTFFNSPDFEKYCRARESLLEYSGGAGKRVLYFPSLNNVTGYARSCTGRAALYYETGQPGKILPELMKMTRIDEDILGDSEFLIVEIIRIACRNIWYQAMVKLGPNDKAYAAFYHEALEFMKSRKIHLPNEAGYYLNMLSSNDMQTSAVEKSGKYAAVLSMPSRMVLAARSVLNALAFQEMLASWEKGNIPDDYELRKDDVASSLWRAALLSRASNIVGTTALALKLYRCEHGKYPDKLEELVPQYLDTVSACPYPGKPLTYESDGTDFSLSYEKKDGGAILKLDSRTAH